MRKLFFTLLLAIAPLLLPSAKAEAQCAQCNVFNPECKWGPYISGWLFCEILGGQCYTGDPCQVTRNVTPDGAAERVVASRTSRVDVPAPRTSSVHYLPLAAADDSAVAPPATLQSVLASSESSGGVLRNCKGFLISRRYDAGEARTLRTSLREISV